MTKLGPIRLTTEERTLKDLAAIGHRRLEPALDRCVRLRKIDPQKMLMELDDPDMAGRRGCRVLAGLLGERSVATAPTHSEMEDLFMRIVRRYRLPCPIGQLPIRIQTYVVHADFAYPNESIAIECDSHTWHTDRTAFERDRERDAELQALGWVVLRFTWRMLRWRQDYVAGQVRRHLEQRSQRLSLH
jgi:very-short-patch-repair endonuclease